MRCIVCDRLAKYRFSPDMDIQGIGACEKHSTKVHIAYILLSKSEEMFNSFIGDERRQYQSNLKVKSKRAGGLK